MTRSGIVLPSWMTACPAPPMVLVRIGEPLVPTAPVLLEQQACSSIRLAVMVPAVQVIGLAVWVISWTLPAVSAMLMLPLILIDAPPDPMEMPLFAPCSELLLNPVIVSGVPLLPAKLNAVAVVEVCVRLMALTGL